MLTATRPWAWNTGMGRDNFGSSLIEQWGKGNVNAVPDLSGVPEHLHDAILKEPVSKGGTVDPKITHSIFDGTNAVEEPNLSFEDIEE